MRNIVTISPTYYRVHLMRDHRNIHGGYFADIASARVQRDALEAQYPAKPHGYFVRKANPRTPQVRRMERLAKGMCAYCGDEPHAPGRVRCASCLGVAREKERNRRTP